MNVFRRLSSIPLALTIGLAAFAFACGGGDDPAPSPTPTVASPTSTPTIAATPTSTPTPFDGEVAGLSIPRFDVDSSIEAIGLIPGINQLDTPRDPLNTGWYDIYDRPGWGGNALFSAHVDYYPNIKGPFNRLEEMVEGDEVVVTMANGDEYKYRVISNTRYHVDEIPMGDLIDADTKPDGEEWITLITCGGEFQSYSGDGGPGRYLHRDVVIAVRYE